MAAEETASGRRAQSPARVATPIAAPAPAEGTLDQKIPRVNPGGRLVRIPFADDDAA